MYPSLELTYASCFFGFITMLSGNRLPFNGIVAMTVSVGFAPDCVGTKLPMAMLAATDIMKQRIADPRSRITFFIFEWIQMFLSDRGLYSGLLPHSKTFLQIAVSICDPSDRALVGKWHR